MRIPSRVLHTGAAVSALALLVTGCSAGADGGDEEATAAAASAAVPAGDPGGHATAEADAPAGDGVTDDDVEAARKIVADMSDEELTGSVVMLTYNGTDVDAAAQVIEERHLAGAIVMGYNLDEGADADAVGDVTTTLAAAAGERGWPVAIGVDQEGGPVARLDQAALDFPPLMAAGAAEDEDVTRDAIRAQAQDLRDMGFTLNFSPVADLTIGADDPVINVRSPGDDPERVSAVVDAAVDGFTSTGLASSAKHFPGHGHLTTDSHEELPVSDESLDDLSGDSYEPFRTATEAGVPMMLVGHIGLPGAEDVPATLNADVYESLREDVGFEGVAVTDALNMGAVSEEPGQETVKAIQAGADLALMPPDSGDAVAALGEALDSGDLERERLEEAATRVVAMQLWQARVGVVGGESADGADADTREAGVDADEALTALADDSLTVLAGECAFEDPTDSIAVSGGSDDARAAFTEAAEAAGLTVEEGADVTVGLGAGAGVDVVVGTSGPWNVEDSGADTIVEVYDGNPASFTAVAKYLSGDLDATGRAPVEVSSDAPDCAGG
ncbi:glycoside hydrolase family 3 N-terminal domain-containing protein [Brevibacterium senegalense]|uniref:glycoside hydrolase family 3 N-terminal domain-containing protein n=1 Tax=Brevibacterium senegalense TaxID=1033736 RepID=UPI00058BDEB6|nr:glycoside hydrolase family 3 N-terminal domain-containing protein [Brevibacterium senegalense]